MAGSDRWYFSKEVLANTPSRKCGIDADKELSYRQQAANLIQDMGQRLHVTQLCINTAIVYMHRFYAFHSFSKFHRNSISSCALFLAAKVEEQPRKLEHVIKVSHMCLHRETPPIDVKSEAYTEQAAELVFNENLMLQTLGFDIAVEHPHTSVVNCCQLVRASKDLAQTSYFMATNSLHLTTMCLQYKPTVVACVCIHLACKWSSWEIPRSTEGKDWFLYVDKSVSLELLEQLTSEFLAILDKCPSRLKRKIMASGGNTSAANVSLKPNDPKRNSSQERHSSKEETKTPMPSKSISQPPNESSQLTPTSPPVKKPKPEATAQQSNKPTVAMTYADYRERKQRTQQESAKQPDQQSLKSNQTVKPVRDMSSQPKDRSLGANDKLAANAKQQQINVDKQRQMDERHKLKAKTSDYFANNRQTTPSKPMSSSQPKLQNSVTEDLFDNLNKPSDFNSIFTADDSLDFKTQITTDLKMEFSDNSNQSNDMLNLASFTSDFINDSSDSKKSLNISNNNNNNSKPQTNADTKQTSFMAIFSNPTPIASTNSSQLNSKPDNTLNIPSKFSSHDVQNMLSRIKPEPMLSPLKSAADIEALSKLEKQSLSAHSLSQPNLKNSLNQSYDSKPNLNSKTSKTPPKKREVPTNSSTSTKNFMPNSFQSNQSPKEDRKDTISESSVNVKLENVTNQTAVDSRNAFITNNFNNNCLNIVNANESSHYLETIAPVVKQEIKEKPFAVDFPSVSSHSRPPMPPISATPDLDIKPNLDLTPDQTRQPVVSSPHQKPINNTTPAAVDQTPSTGKAVAVHNKDDKSKEKSSHDDKHHDKHHKHDKHSHHSHKSKKHKDSHKHKHKDKDKEREKHKRKDKDRDREREKERNRHSDAKDDQSFKVSFSPNKDKTDNSTANVAPLKLKIKKMSVDEPDKDNDVQPNPLKLKIQLNPKDRMTTNTPMTDIEANDSSAGRKRKSSPKSSKKEKIAKYDTESNNSHKSKDDKSSSKSSSKSKKSSNDANLSKKSSINNMFDERHSQVFTATGQPTANSLLAGQGLTGAHGAGPQRSSKAHK